MQNFFEEYILFNKHSWFTRLKNILETRMPSARGNKVNLAKSEIPIYWPNQPEGYVRMKL